MTITPVVISYIIPDLLNPVIIEGIVKFESSNTAIPLDKLLEAEYIVAGERLLISIIPLLQKTFPFVPVKVKNAEGVTPSSLLVLNIFFLNSFIV